MNTENKIDFQKNIAKFIVDLSNLSQYDKKDIKDKMELCCEAIKVLSNIRYYNQQQINRYYLMNNQNDLLNSNYFKY